MVTTYCTDADVRRILQTDFKFATDVLPTKDMVDDAINFAEDDIDHTTQHSWRTTTITNEFYDFPTGFANRAIDYGANMQIYLRHRQVETFSSAAGDKLEIWNGSDYEDWTITKTEGRGDDFWVDNEQGILFIRYYYPYFTRKALRLTYRYGDTIVPKDIRDITAMTAAIQFLEADDRSSMLAETGDPTRLSYSDRIDRMQKRIDKIIKNRTELIVV